MMVMEEKKTSIINAGRFQADRLYVFLAAIIFSGLFFFLSAASAQAAATSTLRGFGWWGGLGAVYFNCADDAIGDRLDVTGNLYSYPEPRGFHFYVSPCVSLVHGVYIAPNGNLSGQAFNSSKGLISFSGTSTPPDGYGSTSSNCPATCNASNSCWACYNEGTQRLYGWARVDADGTWIRLDSALTPPVRLQDCDLTNSIWPGHNIQSGDLAGNASSAYGNLSFNCASENGLDVCSTRDYKVYVGNLTLGHLTAPDWSYAQACNGSARGASLRWCKKSGEQAAYEVAVSTTDSLSTSTAICWSGIKYSDFAIQYNLPNSDPTCGDLDYNSNYYWWVRLYDEEMNPTPWEQYNSNSGGDTDGNPDGNAKTFTTYKHEFPNPFFTWSPSEVLVGTSTVFSALASQYYSSGSPSWPQSCAAPYCNYSWSTTDIGATIEAPTAATTSIVFYSATGTTITLRLADVDNYYCSTSTTLRINYDLPIWREIKAQ